MNDARNIYQILETWESEDNLLAEERPLGVYAFTTAETGPKEVAVLWSDTLRPGIAQTLMRIFGKGRVWSGESTDQRIRALEKVTPRTHIDRLNPSIVGPSNPAYPALADIVTADNKVD